MKKSNRTIGVIFFAFVCVFIVLCLNVVCVSVLGVHVNSGENISNYSTGVNIYKKTLSARRGYIYDRNKEIIAQDSSTYNIYAIIAERLNNDKTPAYVVDYEATAEAVAPYLNMTTEEFLSYLTANPKAYQVEFGSRGRNLSQATRDEIAALNMPGIEFLENSGRVYPNGTFASHLIGFAQFDAASNSIVGKTGIESQYNKYLSGTDGYLEYQGTSDGLQLIGTDAKIVNAENGYDIYLTLDASIQKYLENGLYETLQTFEAEAAWGVIMEVKTGKILGYAGYPSYDLNKKDIVSYMDANLGNAFEPGSTMKPFLIAAAMDTGIYDGEETLRSGLYHVGMVNGEFVRLSSKGQRGYIGTIQDFNSGKGWGEITINEGLIRSSNTAMVHLFIEEHMASTYRDYLTKFGFFKPVDFDVAGSISGNINYTYGMEKITSTFGQGLTVNTLQLLQAYTALFNDGTMVKPYVIDTIRDSYDDSIIYQGETTVLGQPITEQTADSLMQLLTEVIENNEYGSGRFYKIPEVQMAGKTGTAEIAGGSGSYLEEKGQNLYSIMAAAPANDPEVMIFYAVKEPKVSTVHTSTTIFKQIFRSTIMYLNISDEEEVEENTVIEAIFEEHKLDNYANKDVDEVVNELTEKGFKTLVVGNGSDVVSQYPLASTKAFTSQTVFLYTGGDTVLMPDMKGWSRKDVLSFWSFTDIPVQSVGDGYVVEQNIEAGESIGENDTIYVVFE